MKYLLVERLRLWQDSAALRPRIPPDASHKPGQVDGRRAKSTGALRIEELLHYELMRL